MTNLNYSEVGSGPSLVLLHGWGANSAVWSYVQDYFKADYCVRSVDLPGYGENYTIEESDFEASCLLVADVIPDNSIVIAWSLSGLLALNIAKQSNHKINKIVFTCSSPCFVNKSDWLYGVEKNVFEQFSDQLSENHAACLLRFLSLQTRGAKDEKQILKTLRKVCLSSVSPSAKTLQTGLDWLCEIDMRVNFTNVQVPMLFVYGQYDAIVRPKLSEPLQNMNSYASSSLIQGAAHTPFLSHPREFNGLVEMYLNSCAVK